MNHGDIRLAVRRRLRDDHKGEPTLLRFELGICLGATRMDVATVNGRISGYEIKSDRDRLDRLGRQIQLYGRVVDHAVLVTEGRFAAQALDLLPQWWGVWKCVPAGRWPGIEVVRPPGLNLITDPFAVAQLLWRDEALAELTARGLDAGLRSATRWKLWETLAREVPAAELAAGVRRQLRARAHQGW